MSGSTCSLPSSIAADYFFTSIVSLVSLRCEIGDNSIYPMDATPTTEYDFIIVGAGAPACALANRLSRNREWNILLLEAGGDPPYTSEIPAFSDYLINTEIDWKFQSDGTGEYCLGMKDNKCNCPRGKVLGGTSTLACDPYTRGHPKDYARWEREGNDGWDYEHLIPFFKMAEGRMPDDESSEEARASSGEDEEAHLSLEPFRGGELPLLRNLRRAALERGHRVLAHPQKVSRRAFFNTYGLLQDGLKCSGAKAYLPPLKQRPNVHLIRNSVVKKINFSSRRRAVSVDYDLSGGPQTAIAKKEIILSAGTFNTPKILMLSGVGPKKHLTDLQIPVVADLPVGQYLQDHQVFPGVCATINRGRESENLLTNSIRDAAEFLLDRKGTLSGIGYRQFIGFVESMESKDPSYPDIQIEFFYLSKGDLDLLKMELDGNNYNDDVINEFMRLANTSAVLFAFPILMHPKSRGHVQLASIDPMDPPKITLNWYSNPHDEETMLSGIAEAMRLLKTKAMHRLRVEPRALLRECLGRGKVRARPSPDGLVDDSPVMSKRYWRCAMKILTTTAKHPVGTCRMGPSHRDSVVDHHLRVHHVRGLRIVDGCVMPYITTGGITGPGVMIGEKAARMIMRDHRDD